MDDWEVIFEPGAVIVLEMMAEAGRGQPRAVDLQLERYVLDESLLRACRGQAEVQELLREIGVSEAKASENAAKIWAEAEAFLSSRSQT